MVLFHATFAALKARCPLTININPDDYSLAGERTLFRAQVIDDGFEHSLAVFQDDKCGGLRLHAAVWNGELRKCPIWTAFGMSFPSISIKVRLVYKLMMLTRKKLLTPPSPRTGWIAVAAIVFG